LNELNRKRINFSLKLTHPKSLSYKERDFASTPEGGGNPSLLREGVGG